MIYNLKAHPSKMEAEKKPYKYLDTKSSTFISMAFSHTDSRYNQIYNNKDSYYV